MKRQKIKKAMRITLTVMAVICAVFLLGTLAVNLFIVLSEGGSIKTLEEWKDEDKKDLDCIMVLGCSVHPDGSPSQMLKDRLDAAVELYKASPQKILVSGDHAGEYYNEVWNMKAYLVSEGIPSSDIYLDHYGVSTYESVYRAYHLFHVRRMTIVTQKYHLYRALYLADAMGMEVDGYAAKYVRYSGQFDRDFREVFARDKDFLTGIFRPASDMPEYQVSLKEDGDLTDERPE